MKSQKQRQRDVFLLLAALLFLSTNLILSVEGRNLSTISIGQISNGIRMNPSHRVGVITTEKILNATSIKRSFERFLELFHITLNGTTVDFLAEGGLSGFIKQMEGSKYTIVVKALDFNGNTLKDAVGYCHLSQGLSKDFNKVILLWPCPSIKISSSFLPSFEATSFAVKSIAMKLNWTEVVILASDAGWGLPLAIAANLQIPYRLEVGLSHLDEMNVNDKIGQAIIITTPINDNESFTILNHLTAFNHTKILLIDIIASSFYEKSGFYRIIGNFHHTSKLPSNLLILTVLSDKFRYFLNSAFHEKGMGFVRNFRQSNEWKHKSNLSDFQSILDSLRIQFKCRIHQHITSESIVEWCTNVVRNVQTCLTFTKDDEEQLKIQIQKLCTLTNNTNKNNNNNNVLNPLEGDDILNKYFHLFDFVVSNLQSSSVGVDLPNFDFLVLDVQKNMNNGFKWRPFLILEQSEINQKLYTSHPILPGYNDWLLDGTNALWQCGNICWTIIGISIILLLCIVCASVAAGIAVRNYFLRKRLSKGPNKIVLSASDFVFPVDARRVDEGIEAMLCCWLQQLQEFGGPEVDKPDLLKGSIGSLKNLGLAPVGKNNSGSGSLARHNNINFLDMRARYNGDLVQLKEIPLNGSFELKSKAMDTLVMMHGLRHENINPLIGWLSDPSRTAMVFDYCSRGSLQDVLIMDEIKLDWSFRLSLLTDLVRGMRYLHSSPIRVHGSLSSRNCVVDARWVLKITDYGLPSFYEGQGLTLPTKTPKELLWTAPELLRNPKGSKKDGTQMGDVYAFGIIMQEVVVRGEPYCMLSLTPEEIIAKIKKPPPLIRPSVSKGAAPPEAINIMRQCWAEMPDMRPDFNSVYERFKILNHGRKVNFVDTMFQMLEKYSNNLEELIRERTEQLDIERKKTEQLLNRMLPSSVAEKLKMGLAVDPEEFSDVTIYFSDIVGFTTIAAHCSPVQVVDLLNDLYTIFDATINAYSVYKVETIGDAYMVVSGLPVRIPDHAEQIATMALDLLHQSGQFKVKHLPGVPLQLRIGLHTGPCCAGVVGLTMPRYCLFGDTVNTASRMESTGSSWRIHMSEVTRNDLENAGGYLIEPRGPIEIKGKGLMNTYWLLGKKGFDKPVPTPPPIGESHGLDESLIRNSIILKAAATKSRNCSTNPSSSQSSSLAGESVEVKVEITPPINIEPPSVLPNSYSLDSNTANVNSNLNLIGEFQTKTPGASPQQRKLSELSPDSLLNPVNFNRLNPSSAGGSSSRLYKKIEEMIDLSSPYNHYKCLSPSESNLSQYNDGKYLYSVGKLDNRPGSTRLLRRQFSLDKDDGPQQSSQAQTKQTLDVPILQETRCSPKCQIPRLHKQNSTSITQDLEKIEEIPMSPASSQQHSSLDSNLNRSPPTGPGLGNSPVQRNNRTQEIQLNAEALMTR